MQKKPKQIFIIYNRRDENRRWGKNDHAKILIYPHKASGLGASIFPRVNWE